MNGLLSYEVVVKDDADAAPEVAECLTDTLVKAAADLLDYQELARRDAVETSVLEGLRMR